MADNPLSRRQILAGATAAAAAAAVPGITLAGQSRSGVDPFKYCLNTSTIRGQNLSLEDEIKTAAKAGYDAIEPWVRKIQDYQKNGGDLKEIKKLLEDSNLTVESAITFPSWIVDDDQRRAGAVEQMKREMDLLAAIGGKRIAAPPAGATRTPGLDLDKAAERYRTILEIGDFTGVTPQIEVWGPSANLHLLGQAMYVVLEARHPKACLLPDIYHIYKGGGSATSLKQLSPQCVQVIHVNDYPADPPRDKIGDRDRVMPGDGIAPVTQVLRDMLDNHNHAVLSLELFSPKYWEPPALDVAKEGLAKMKIEVAKALTTT